MTKGAGATSAAQQKKDGGVDSSARSLPVVLVLLQPRFDLGALPPDMLSDPVARWTGAFAALLVDSGFWNAEVLGKIFDAHQPIVILRNRPAAWTGWLGHLLCPHPSPRSRSKLCQSSD